METMKPKSAIYNRSKKFAKTFQKVISLKSTSNNGICMLNSNLKVKEDPFTDNDKNEHHDKARNKAVMEALIARLFAGVTTIKAAYAELQMAQHPYNNDSIQLADQAVVDELRSISELKRRFLKKDLDLSPQVTIMLAEIQEQQSIMKTYEITIKKLQSEVDIKASHITSLRKNLEDSISFNKSLEKKLNSSGPLSFFDNLKLSVLNPTHFVHFLHHTLRSVKSFVKLMILEMESAHWDIESAVKFIHPNAVFTKQHHRTFAFESFVCITMFEGFSFPNFCLLDDSQNIHQHNQNLYFEKFKRVKSMNTKQYLTQNPNSSFARFLKSKYLQVVHAKMECSLFGNLNQRKLVNSGGYPDSAFFTAFAEMAKRVWTLHCLAMSFQEGVNIFQVKKNTRFSEVYMESVTHEPVSTTSRDSTDSKSGELRAVFTVVPGFKIGKTVVQSQVYLTLVDSPVSNR